MTIRRRDAIGAFFIVLAFAALCGLGVWQLKRAAWKHALIEKIAESERLPPRPIGPDPAAQEWQRVTVSGVFLNDKAVRIIGAIRNGEPGFRLVVPLERDGESDVLVDRGFVPMGDRLIREDKTPVTITGRLRLAAPPALFAPANQPQLDRWYRVDPAAIARYRELESVAPYYVEAAAPAGPLPPLPPYPGYAAADLPDNHMQYAFTWFGMAAVLVLMSAGSWYGRRRRA